MTLFFIISMTTMIYSQILQIEISMQIYGPLLAEMVVFLTTGVFYI